MWETTSEGSPISPVFKTPQKLASWLEQSKASAFAGQSATYDEWLEMIHEGQSHIMGVIDTKTGKVESGVSLAQKIAAKARQLRGSRDKDDQREH